MKASQACTSEHMFFLDWFVSPYKKKKRQTCKNGMTSFLDRHLTGQPLHLPGDCAAWVTGVSAAF